MITIEYIYIEGFGSIVEEVKYKFGRPGLNLITGTNGVGKTTILNALSWCLYKQLVKKGATKEPWPHVLTQAYQGCKVRVELHDGKDRYEIIRCENYKGKVLDKKGGNNLYILQGGKDLSHLRDKKDREQWICEKLGYSFELFKSSVLFGQKLKRLMGEDGPTKKKIFDEAFETEFINRAADTVKKRMEGSRKELVKITGQLATALQGKTGMQKQIEQAKEMSKTFQDRIAQDLKEVEGDLAEVTTKLSSLAKNLSSPSNKQKEQDLRSQIDLKEQELKGLSESDEFKAMLEVSNIQGELETAKRDLNTLKDELLKAPKKCSKCGEPLPKEKVDKYKKDLHQKAKSLKAEIKVLEAKLPKAEKRHKKALAQKAKCKDLEKAVWELKTALNRFEQDMKTISNEMKAHLHQKSKYEAKIKKLLQEKPPQINLTTLKEELAKFKEQVRKFREEEKTLQKAIRIDDWLLKDPLSNAGLKAFIFDSLIGKVNNHLKAYKPIIGFEIKVYIEMASARKDICISVFRNGHEVPYEDLSGGQMQLVDVTIAFALHDTVNSIKPINLLILDEAFESLSIENVETVGNIIIKKAQTKAVHLITHQRSFNPINSYITQLKLNDKGHTVVDTKFRQI